MSNTTTRNITVVKKQRMKRDKVIFLITAMTLPLIQFFIMYVMVNFNSITLSFKKYITNDDSGAFIFCGFANFVQVIKDFGTQANMQYLIRNSFTMYLVTSPLILISCMFLAYTVWKKVLFSKFFSVMLFLPSILPSLVFVIIGKFTFQNLFPAITGIPEHGEILNPPQGFTTLLWYQFFISFGPNTIYFLGAMSNISPSVVEAGKLDGANTFREFIHIVFPSIFPTISTFVITGVAGIFINQANLYNFFGGGAHASSYTIGYYLFVQVIGTGGGGLTMYPYAAAGGLILTLIAAPTTLTVKYLLEKFGPSED